MKILAFLAFMLCAPALHAAFKTDYLNATSSATVSGPITVNQVFGSSMTVTGKWMFSSTGNTYFYFDGDQVCLYVLGASQECWPAVVTAEYLLLESGDFVLLESGDKIILE